MKHSATDPKRDDGGAGWRVFVDGGGWMGVAWWSGGDGVKTEEVGIIINELRIIE